MTNYRHDFAERLRMAVAKHDLKRIEFAEKVGIRPGTATAYMKGDSLPNVEVARSIAEVLEVDANWLIGVNR